MFKDEDLKVFEKPSEQIVCRYLSLFGFKDDQCQVGKKGYHIHTLHFDSSVFVLTYFVFNEVFVCVCVCLSNPLERRKGEESPFTAPTHPISPGTGDPHGWRRTPRTNLLVSPSFAIHGNYLWHFRGALTYSVWLHQPQIKTHIFETWNCTLEYSNL